MKISFKGVFAVSLCISLIILIYAAGTGSAKIPPATILKIIFGQLGGAVPEADIPRSFYGIVMDLRLPRILLAWLAGAAFSVSGAVMQSVLRNPLASPFTLGVSAGASLGAGLVILVGVSIPFAGPLTVPFAGFTAGLATVMLLLGFSRALDPRLDSNTIILAGMVLSLFINAALTMISALAGQEMSRLIMWQMGSFALKGWAPVKILALPIFIGISSIFLFSRELDILTLGDEEAESLGVGVKHYRRLLIGIASVLAGSTVAFVGVIGFVDLAIPHLVRKITGPSHRKVIPLSAVAGGTAMVLADLAARTLIVPLDLPVGAITAIAGAPVFAWIYLSARKKN